MRSRNTLYGIALLAAAQTAVVGCYKHAQRGAVIGGGAGAVVGGAIGAATGSTVKGAIIGAAVGGAAGAIIGDQMDRHAKEIDQSVPGAEVVRVGEGIAVKFDSGILFAFNSDELQSEGRRNLTQLAASFDKYEDSDLMIVGHTDAVGSESYNEDLSERRAEAARRFLVAQGVSADRIRTAGRGELEPIASNDSEAGRQENRRVEVAIFASEELQEQAKREAAAR
jgi:outer membrane protein OmpA-like peptidoglycan-associated protein